jgi:hypothetical protein
MMKVATTAALITAAAAKDLTLTWADCGENPHAPISDFSPAKVTLGQKTTMTGHGKLDEQVTSATFELKMTGVIGTLLKCSGDASQSKTCPLPLGTGSITFDAMTFPISPGTVPVNVELDVSSHLPAQLERTTTTASATDQNGQQLFCIEIKTVPASEQAENVEAEMADSVMKALKMLSPSLSAASSGISLKHSDCGKGSHAPIVDFSPSAIALGTKTTMVGHGKLDETVASAKFDLTMTSPALGTMLHCSGDASQTKSCPLPMGFGSLTMQGMSFPLSPGTVPVNVDIYLKESTPKDLLTTTTVAKASDEKGEEIFCIQIDSTPTGSGKADVIV